MFRTTYLRIKYFIQDFREFRKLKHRERLPIEIRRRELIEAMKYTLDNLEWVNGRTSVKAQKVFIDIKTGKVVTEK